MKILLTLLLLTPSLLLAKFAHEVDFGMTLYKGNTDAKHFNGKYHNQFTHRTIEQNLFVSGLLSIGKNNIQETLRIAEKYNAKDLLKVNLSEQWFIYGQLEGNRDHFSAFTYDFNESIGIGRVLLKSPEKQWNVRMGGGGRHHKIREDKDYYDEFMGHFETDLSVALSQQSGLKEWITVTSSSLNTKIKSISEIKTTLVKPIAAKFSVEIEYVSKLPPSSKRVVKTDSTTAFSLSYSF